MLRGFDLGIEARSTGHQWLAGRQGRVGFKEALKHESVETLETVRLNRPVVGQRRPTKKKTKGKNMKKQLHTMMAIATGCLLVLSANFSTAAMNGRNPNPGIALPNSQPAGASYSEWEALALQWYYSIPTTAPPPPPRVIGNMVVPPPAGFAGVTVPVTMKVGQWFLVPMCFLAWANTPGDWGYDHPWSDPYTDPNTGIAYPTYEAWAREVMKEVTDQWPPTSTIDGVPVQNIDFYRMQTGLFDLVLPDENAWGVPAGTYSPCFADGWFAILPPMKPGKHTVTNAIGEGAFVTYEITVIAGE